jgi:plasmid replication initiation protein
MSTGIVTKSNHLIEASYKLSLNEQRLVLSAISQLDGRKPIPKENEFTITAAEFSKTFDIPIKQAYETLDDAASKLYERDIKTYDRNAKTRDRFRWVDHVRYWDGEAKVTLGFSRWITPYLTLLHQQFTSYELKQVSQLKTAYAIRFYELLIQFIKTGERYITLNRLKESLELGDQYARFHDLKKRIIDPSILEINQKTNLTVEWDVVKKGRTITGLMFLFQDTDQLKLQL